MQGHINIKFIVVSVDFLSVCLSISPRGTTSL